MIKQLIFVLLIALIVSQDVVCPAKLAAQCEQDLELAFQSCDKAAKQKGADQTADINCVKFLLTGKKDCWPCICVASKKLGFKIRGCEAFINFLVDFGAMLEKNNVDKFSNLIKL